MTPGWPGEMVCGKGRFYKQGGAIDYREIILQAENCKHFEYYKEESKPEKVTKAIRKLDIDD